MHWLKCSLFVTTLCATYWHDSAAQTDLSNNSVQKSILDESRGNDNTLKLTDSAEFEPIFTVKITRDSTANLTDDPQEARNVSGESKEANSTASDSGVQFDFNSEPKREVTNVTFNDIKPLLFFPILPFLFPSGEKENQSSRNELLTPQNERVKVDGSPTDVKPFILFDFAFIRRIPLNNASNNTNDSNVINVKKLRISKTDDFKKSSLKNRRRRNTSVKLDIPEFFDESPLFPDSELDEFLPKSDLFFPDLPFHHHKALKKLSRRRRDQKKPDLKSDLKFFFDAFDEAFKQTKRELEQTDPILNFLRGGQPPFDDDKNKDVLGQVSNVQEKPRMKWRIQRNIKRLKNDHQNGLRKDQDGPVIIVDKVVKIGEFHVPDERLDKSKKKTRDGELKKKLLGDEITSFEKDEAFSKNILDLKQEDKRSKRNHLVKLDLQNDSMQSQVPQMTNMSAEINDRDTQVVPQANKSMNVKNLMNVIGTLKANIKLEARPSLENYKPGDSVYSAKLTSKKTSYENLKRNITELLNQFLSMTKNSGDVKLVSRIEHNEHDEGGVFDWTEKETLLNSNALEKNSRERRQKKDTDFVDEYADLSKKERQIVDLNYLFLTVTLPTVFAFALVLLVCFFSLQVKGKICSRLFRPRQVFIVDDDKFMQYKQPTRSKLESI